MYTPAWFAENRTEVLYEFIRQHPLGAIVTYTEQHGLEANHIPMLLDETGGVLRCHLARSNPQWEILAGDRSALVIFGGAEHYVTPSWYPAKAEHGKVVPTWNYAAVHVSGRARVLDTVELMSLLRDLTDVNEAGFQRPWSIDDAPAGYVQSLTNAIVGFEIRVERIQGKWKHSQNRSDADRESVIAGLEALGTPRATELARAMSGRS
jgi:transcriptional regulator